MTDDEYIGVGITLVTGGNEERLHLDEGESWSGEIHSNDAAIQLDYIDGVSESGLRELVEQWRYENAVPAGSNGHVEYADAMEKCAEELEALLE